MVPQELNSTHRIQSRSGNIAYPSPPTSGFLFRPFGPDSERNFLMFLRLRRLPEAKSYAVCPWQRKQREDRTSSGRFSVAVICSHGCLLAPALLLG